MIKIYAIKNPVTGEVFYVGASKNPQQRFNHHISGGSWHPITYRYKQMRILRQDKILPELLILEEVGIDKVQEREEYYINYYISLGCKLTQQKSSGYPAGSKHIYPA